MSTTTYQLDMTPQTLRHELLRELPAWFGDYDEDELKSDRDFNVFDAMAASGDYFIMLATRLDKMAQGLPQDSAEQIELEHLVTMLFYLQDHYDLVYKFKK